MSEVAPGCIPLVTQVPLVTQSVWVVPALAALEDWLPFFPVAIILLVMLFAGASVWLAEISRRRRTQQVEQAAKELSLVFCQSLAEKHQSQLSVFPLMQLGGGGLSSNALMADNDSIRLVLFDHKYTVGSGKNKSTHNQTVAWIYSDAINLPEFSLTPESWWHRIGDLLTKQDIDFDDDPAFSSRFLLTGPDSATILSFFTVQRRQALQKINKPTIEAGDKGFIFYRPGQIVGASNLKDLMSDAFSVYQIFVG